MEVKLPEILAKSRDEVSNLTGLSHSRGRNCKNRMCLFTHLYICSYKCLSCLCGWLSSNEVLSTVLWHPWWCLSVSEETEEKNAMPCFFVCVRRLVLQVWTRCKPSGANSDTAVATHPQHLLGILSVDYEQRWKKRRKKNCMESSWGGVCGFLSSFAKKKKETKKSAYRPEWSQRRLHFCLCWVISMCL